MKKVLITIAMIILISCAKDVKQMKMKDLVLKPKAEKTELLNELSPKEYELYSEHASRLFWQQKFDSMMTMTVGEVIKYDK